VTVIFLLIVGFIVRKIVKPVSQCLTISKEIDGGQYSLETTKNFGSDEIGMLARTS
jgi:nitrate/nitrite-specific signal transduction histidine kinase